MAGKSLIETANSLTELREKVENARSFLKPGDNEEVWYRGVSNREFQLLPTLFRCFRGGTFTEDDVRELESNLFFEFLAKARTGDGSVLDHWDVLFLMQHYRAPTRLLDWTEVLYVALYFAVGYLKPDQTPRIYMINPYAWNEKFTESRELFWPRYFGWDPKTRQYYEYGEILDEGGVDWEFPVALYPPQRDARLSAQRGFFTIHGTDPRPLDAISPGLIAAIDLMPGAVSDVKEALEYGGFNEFSLFPDLEGLSRHLKKRYKIE
jgi:hypothetical protein